jgi:hypothetical protein
MELEFSRSSPESAENSPDPPAKLWNRRAGIFIKKFYYETASFFRKKIVFLYPLNEKQIGR